MYASKDAMFLLRSDFLTSKELQEKINKHNYWDLPIEEIKVDDFCNNVKIKYYHEKDIIYNFLNCYKVVFKHCICYEKDTQDLPPCFFRDIQIENINEEGKDLYKVNVDAYPIELEIWCEEV